MPNSPQFASSISRDTPDTVSDSTLPAELNLFNRNGPDSEVGSNSTEFVLAAFGAVHVLNHNNDPFERPETIESKAHPALSELTNLMIGAFKFRVNFNRNHFFLRFARTILLLAHLDPAKKMVFICLLAFCESKHLASTENCATSYNRELPYRQHLLSATRWPTSMHAIH